MCILKYVNHTSKKLHKNLERRKDDKPEFYMLWIQKKNRRAMLIKIF
jgi:hypothetical protein